MKNLFFLVLLAFICIPIFSQQQERNTAETLDWDIDKIFDELQEDLISDTDDEKNETTENISKNQDEVKNKKENEALPSSSVIDQIRRNSITFTAAYRFNVGIIPSWGNLPWEDEFKNEEFYYLERYIKLRSTFTIDAQISGVFRVYSSIYFSIPQSESLTSVLSMELRNFYFDYNFYEKVFVRAGKYNLKWGISPNYDFTNLLARIPAGDYGRDSFILKADIPVKAGGFQFLALTRANLYSSNANPKKEDFGIGAKYNLALKIADFDWGMYYQEGMPFRTFLSAKTTIKETELYTEGLLAFNTEVNNVSGAFNIGLGRDFFGNKLSVNCEMLVNGEKGTYWYEEETLYKDASSTPFVEGVNFALNIVYRPFEKTDPRVYLSLKCDPFNEKSSAQIIPGFRFTPWQHIEFYFALPVSLGKGYYYENSYITAANAPDNKNAPLPFAFVFLVSVNGSASIRRNL